MDASGRARTCQSQAGHHLMSWACKHPGIVRIARRTDGGMADRQCPGGRIGMMRSVAASLGLIVVLVLCLPGSLARAGTIADLPWKSADATEGVTVTAVTGSKPTHVVIQFDRVPTEQEKEALATLGTQVLGYLGDNAYFAKIANPQEMASAVGAVEVLATAAIQPAWKTHPKLLRGEFPEYARAQAPARKGKLLASPREATEAVDALALYVIFHSDVRIHQEVPPLIEKLGGVVRDFVVSINLAVVWIPTDQLGALAAADIVQWIELPLPPLDVNNDSNRVVTQADLAQAAPYGLDGSGINVLVYDGGYALDSHGDFGGRLTVRDSSGLHDHPTHVAGTIGGSGAGSGGQYRGMAPAVIMESYGFDYDGTGTFLYTNPGDIEVDYNEAINVYGSVISNNSIGTNTAANGFDCAFEGDYGATSILIDAIVRGSLGSPMRVVWANGNERGSGRCGSTYLTTAPPACAKNHITVGALNSNDDSMTSFSSWGPTDDGRMKPDVSAPGCQSSGDFGVTSTVTTGGYDAKCGTSMASPTVCGLSALLLQDWKVQRPTDPLPRNSMLKALLAHNAVDLGNTGPDYIYGYGSVRIKDTIDFMRGGSLLDDVEIWHGQTLNYELFVPASTPFVKVTLAWDDVPGTANTIPELVNDLDLTVTSPTATTHYPWTLDPANPSNPAAQTGPNRRDNIEQVYVAGPASGSWTISVSGYNVPQGPQPFSIVATPVFQACSSAGSIGFDAQRYACGGSMTIALNDCDLNTNDTVIETTSILVTSDSEPGGETVVLTETQPPSAVFTGQLPIATTNSAGVLFVQNGDTITATYQDADDGTGSPATVQQTAPVDCQPPQFLSITTTEVSYDHAVTEIVTDEPTRLIVWYGTSCSSPSAYIEDRSYSTTHSVRMGGLAHGTRYYYYVDAVDLAGNLWIDNNGGACYSYTTLIPPDFFTEYFWPHTYANYVLPGHMTMFAPDGSGNFYRACTDAASGLPSDTVGGQLMDLSQGPAHLGLTGDNRVWLYGVPYQDFYVNWDGSITFGSPSSQGYTGSLESHFAQPRISGLFAKLRPWAPGAEVKWKEHIDRATVTYKDVHTEGRVLDHTFQIEMFFDGRIRITWEEVQFESYGFPSDEVTVGLSEGLGLPGYWLESEMIAYDPCPEYSDVDFDLDGDVDMTDFGHMQACLSGSAVPQTEPDCWQTLLDVDDDVDTTDLNLFLGCLSGAGVPADPDCP